jgi:hypothetical protein
MKAVALCVAMVVCGWKVTAQTNVYFTATAVLDASTVQLTWVDNGSTLGCTDNMASAQTGFWRILAGPSLTNRWYVAERCSQLGQPFFPSQWAVGPWVGNCVTNVGTEGNDNLQNSATAAPDCLIQLGNGGDDVLTLNAASSGKQEVLIQDGGAGNNHLTAVGGNGGNFIWQNGGGGHNTLFAGGGTGDDWIFQLGGNGNSTITNTLSAGHDTCWINGGSGTNHLVIINPSQTYALFDINTNLLHSNTNGTAGTSITAKNLKSILCQDGVGNTSWQSDPVINEAWAATWGGTVNNWNGEIAHSCAVDTYGNVYVSGEYQGTVDFNPGPATNSATANGPTAANAYLSKFDANGNFQWVRNWGSTNGRCSANGVAVDATNGVYASGLFQYSFNFFGLTSITSNATGANNMMICKFDSNGNAQWVRAWGGHAGGESYTITVSGTNVYAVGDYSVLTNEPVNFSPWESTAHWQTNHGFFDAWLMKLDSNGHYLWSDTWGGGLYDDCPGIAVDPAGFVYASGLYASADIDFDPHGGGKTNSPADNPGTGPANLDTADVNPAYWGMTDVFLSKFDPADGNLLWTRTWGGTNLETGPQVLAQGTNSVYMVGQFASVNVDFNRTNVDFHLGGPPDIHTNYGGADAFICEYDGSGNYLWGKSWGGTNDDDVRSVVVDAAGNPYCYGVFNDTVNFNPAGSDLRTAPNYENAFLVKLGPDGTYQWTRTFGSPGDASAWAIAIDPHSNAFYLSGSFSWTCNFDPGAGTDIRSGTDAAFLCKFVPWPW